MKKMNRYIMSTKKKMSKKMRLLLASPFLVVALIMITQDGKEGYDNPEQVHNIITPEWDVENMNITENDNITRAMTTLDEIDDISKKAEAVTLEQLNRRLWDYIGKPVKTSGYVASIIDYSPTHTISKMFGTDTSCEIGFLSEEMVFCTFLCDRSSGSLKQNDLITVYGIPVGTASGENKMGGSTEQIVIVGNRFE